MKYFYDANSRVIMDHDPVKPWTIAEVEEIELLSVETAEKLLEKEHKVDWWQRDTWILPVSIFGKDETQAADFNTESEARNELLKELNN